jgi:acylglycerol lipase
MHSDIEVLLRHASVELPCFLYGHSMGGGLILSLALNNPDINLAGIIATSALIDLPKDRNITPFKKFMIKAIGKELEVRYL